MQGLKKPLNQPIADGKQKDEVIQSHFEQKQTIKQILDNSIVEKEYEEPQKIFSVLFSTALLFSFFGTIIICTEILLTCMHLDSSTPKLFYFKIGFCLSSIISFSTYIYLSIESVQWYPLCITKSLRLSFLFTIITFLIGLYIFTETKTEDWVCEYIQYGEDCYSGTSVKPANYQEQSCNYKMPQIECYILLSQLIIKYGILVCCGIPLLNIILAVIKYIYKNKQRENNLKQSGISQDYSQSDKLKQVEMHYQPNPAFGQDPDSSVSPFAGNQTQIENKQQFDESNLFSNKVKYVYNNGDTDIIQYVTVSNKSMFNPNFQINNNANPIQVQQAIPNGNPDHINNPVYNNSNTEYNDVKNDQL